jgi:hypothetical protein
MMEPLSLITFARSAKTISDFAFGPGIKDAVSAIVGDVHVNAAKLALETAGHAVDRNARVNSVITHLEAAHTAYANIYNQAGFIKENTDWQACRNARFKDVWVCCVMALCYAAQGEHWAVMNSLTLAERAFENKDPDCPEGVFAAAGAAGKALIELPIVFLSLLNLRNWNEQDELMTKEQFAQFRTALQCHVNAGNGALQAGAAQKVGLVQIGTAQVGAEQVGPFKAEKIWNEPYGRPSRPQYRVSVKA